MRYVLSLILYIVVADVIVFFAAYRLREYGPIVLAVFIVIAVYVAIEVGRRVLGREKL